MIKVNAIGDACPLPVVKTLNAIKEIQGDGEVQVQVDNEIAVQNLTKMAKQRGYAIQSEKLEEKKFQVTILVKAAANVQNAGSPVAGNAQNAGSPVAGNAQNVGSPVAGNAQNAGSPVAGNAENVGSPVTGSGQTVGERKGGESAAAGMLSAEASPTGISCTPDKRKNTVIAIASSRMGEGSEELGEKLMKAFIFAIGQQEELPSAILFYNGGAYLTCLDSPAIEDLKALEAQGVEILTCGTCLDYYGLKEKLQVGAVTNMYSIAETMMNADTIIKP